MTSKCNYLLRSKQLVILPVNCQLMTSKKLQQKCGKFAVNLPQNLLANLLAKMLDFCRIFTACSFFAVFKQPHFCQQKNRKIAAFLQQINHPIYHIFATPLSSPTPIPIPPNSQPCFKSKFPSFRPLRINSKTNCIWLNESCLFIQNHSDLRL